ncbi:hypothetical protein QCA50_003357 [Cerrena zonata]|uniref:Uncharacterized protein n=1 Tax=Cerrena zonata TaxID=2478898 RepID=A0AAW0GRW9_9APHY
MRFITFFAFATLLATTSARPIVHRRGIILETYFFGCTDVGPTDLPTATSDPEVTNSGDLASATATDAPTSVASSTDPTVTDPSNSVDPLSASATPTDTTNATDVSATATDSFTDTATATASASISFVIPTVPTACVAKLNDPSLTPSSTVSADFSQNTASADLTTTSDNSTVTDTGLSANATSTDTDSLSATATASVSASGSASASTASATASEPDGTPSATASESDSTDLPQPTGALPLVTKRIAQEDLPDVAQAWQDLCLVSGGDIFTEEPCVILAGVNGINALLANADPCDQQDNADAMIDFAKSDGVTNKDELIANAIAYRQHPRNALNIEGIIPSTPYCQKAPRNQELVGVVNDQLPGVNPGIFGGPTFGLVAFGDPSSCPLGTSPERRYMRM